ncbi:MAG: hypothetical protein K8R74_00940 [Bacteroidales bacterium]|nr:hypothetical protein [Bacteroidales bacterium]
MLVRLIYPVVATDLTMPPGYKPNQLLQTLHQLMDATSHDWRALFTSGKMALKETKTLAGKNIT